MPTTVIRARAALALPWALLCACLLMLTAAPLAEASTPAGIRVVAPDGQTLAEASGAAVSMSRQAQSSAQGSARAARARITGVGMEPPLPRGFTTARPESGLLAPGT